MTGLKTFLIVKYRKLRTFYNKKLSRRFLFEVQLADHCNLNCASCSHFSPIADEKFIDVSKYEKDCEKFAELAKNNVHKIHLLGGEPLLHPNISDIIKITRKYFTKCKIKIATNGILLDQMNEDFWKTCNANNIIISINYYPIKINTKKITELSSQYHVKVESFRRTWDFTFRKDIVDINGTHNSNDSFKKCLPVCHQLYEGKLYMCRVPAYIKYVNKYFSKDFSVSEGDYLDIYKIKNVNEIITYIRNPIPFCRYCNMNDGSIFEWCISKKESSEWL